MKARRFLACFACLLSSACIEDQLTIEIATQVLPDGSCTRRIEYRLERIDTEKGNRVEITPDSDPLRLFYQFPHGEAWSVRDDARRDLHVVTVEGSLANPQQIEGDYSRSPGPRALSARNLVSFAMDANDSGDASYEYSETFRDPSSPLEGMRALAQGLLKRHDEFANRFMKAIGDSPFQRREVGQTFRKQLAQPFVDDVAGISARPLFGPRERKELQDLWQKFDAHQKEFAERLATLAPTVSRERIDAAIEQVQEPIGNQLQRELGASGLPLPSPEAEPVAKIHYRASLTLPGAIVRANTCVQGDTATWEFDQDDLYGRGFEMWARAVTR